jgi:hypothetical protein
MGNIQWQNTIGVGHGDGSRVELHSANNSMGAILLGGKFHFQYLRR